MVMDNSVIIILKPPCKTQDNLKGERNEGQEEVLSANISKVSEVQAQDTGTQGFVKVLEGAKPRTIQPTTTHMSTCSENSFTILDTDEAVDDKEPDEVSGKFVDSDGNSMDLLFPEGGNTATRKKTILTAIRDNLAMTPQKLKRILSQRVP